MISNSEPISGKAATVSGMLSRLNQDSQLERSPVSHISTVIPIINGNTDAIGCGSRHLKDQGGSWSDGKWYNTFDLVLKTSHTGVEGLTSRSSTQPATTTAQNWQTIVNMLNNAGRKNSSSNQKNGDRPVTAMSAKLLCRRAVEIPNGEAMWEGDIKWKPEVDEAIRRGFSPKDCAEMTGRKVTVQRQPKKNSPSNGLTERLSKLKKLFDLGLINKSDYEKKKNEILKAL